MKETPFKKWQFANKPNTYSITQFDVVIYDTTDAKKASKLLTLLNRNWNLKDADGRCAMIPTNDIVSNFI